jgi:hypothetical protein
MRWATRFCVSLSWFIDSCENRGTSSAQVWTDAPHKVNTAAAPHSRRMKEFIHFSYFG